MEMMIYLNYSIVRIKLGLGLVNICFKAWRLENAPTVL